MASVILSGYDTKLIEAGVDSFSTNEYNDYVMNLAQSKGLKVNEITPEFLLDRHKQLKIQSFSALCENEILDGFVSGTTGHTYRTNINDQINFMGKYLVVKEDETITTVFWKAEELGEQVLHTREEFLAVYREAFDHKEGRLFKLHTLRNAIKNCVTDEEVVSVVW
jgi:hypothetical protein